MQLKYVDTKEEIIAVNKKSKHIEPHLHNALEIVCVTSGTLELGVGQELYHMEKGDIGFVFPDIIHHYQVLTPGVNKATYLIASPFTIGKFADIMQSMAPEYPVIKAEKVEPEVYRVINAIRAMWGAMTLFTRRFPIYQQISKRSFHWKRWRKTLE